MTAVVDIPAELSGWLDELVRRLSELVDLDAVYLHGSAAQGTYRHGRSDVDAIAVSAGAVTRAEKEAIVEAAEALRCPARKLELVVYARGCERPELNVNTGQFAHLDPGDDPGFWFVLDRAIAEQHAIPLLGPPWSEVFAPVPPAAVRDALAEAARSDGWEEARGAELARARARIWEETGTWVSKVEAGGPA